MANMLVIKEKNPVANNKRNFTNKPETRFENIIKLLGDDDNYKIIENTNLIDLETLKKLNVHNVMMLDFLSKCYLTYKEHKQKNPNDDTFGDTTNGVIPYNITKKSIDDEIIKKIPYYQQIGIWSSDIITPIFSNTFEQAISSASNCWVVPEYILQGYNRIYCANINPGHHASYDKYGGYCYLNNGAICAKSLLDDDKLQYKKIAILDLDYHAGDGTEEIFKLDDNILTISIHINPFYDYPFYSSFDTTSNMISNHYHNFTFEPKCDIVQYLILVEKSMNLINEFNPDGIIIAFGGDTYKNDLDALEQNRTNLDIEDYKTIGNKINMMWNSNKPIITTQEGGYNMDNIAEIVKSFLSGLF